MRLETNVEGQMTKAMKDIMVTITVEVVKIFAIVTRELKQRRTSGLTPMLCFPTLIEIQRNTSRNQFKGMGSRMGYVDWID